MEHVIDIRRAAPAVSHLPNLLPTYHFKCSCGHDDDTRMAPVGLQLRIQAHEASHTSSN